MGTTSTDPSRYIDVDETHAAVAASENIDRIVGKFNDQYWLVRKSAIDALIDLAKHSGLFSFIYHYIIERCIRGHSPFAYNPRENEQTPQTNRRCQSRCTRVCHQNISPFCKL